MLIQSSETTSELKIPHKTGHSLDFLIEIQILGQDGNQFEAVNGE